MNKSQYIDDQWSVWAWQNVMTNKLSGAEPSRTQPSRPAVGPAAVALIFFFECSFLKSSSASPPPETRVQKTSVNLLSPSSRCKEAEPHLVLRATVSCLHLLSYRDAQQLLEKLSERALLHRLRQLQRIGVLGGGQQGGIHHALLAHEMPWRGNWLRVKGTRKYSFDERYIKAFMRVKQVTRCDIKDPDSFRS